MKIKLGMGECNMASVALWCDGELYDFTGDKGSSFEYVCTDSREADEHTMFVATRGERVDAHDYIIKAIENGCRCILCEYVPTNISGMKAAYAVVENSIDAFAACAKGYRSGKYMPVVAITGSVGKTTTKEFTACVLSEGFNLYSTEGNFNSVIGMPMSMLEVGGDCEAAVFEMGMSGFGEIRQMSQAASPKIAAITNIGTSHLEFLGTRENIAKAKYEITEGLREGGILLLNGDEPLLRELAKNDCKRNFNVLFASACGNGDFCAENIRFTSESSIFDLKYSGGEITDISVPAIGLHIVYDALFACAIGLLMGLCGEQIKQGIAKYTPKAYRQRIYDAGGFKIIADCYNASPESMRSALDVLANIDGKRKIAVLGDMRELGKHSAALHRGVGKFAADKKIDVLLTVGELGAHIAEGAALGGMSEENIYSEIDESAENTVKTLREIVNYGDVILFKASRSMKFERIIEEIEKTEQGK